MTNSLVLRQTLSNGILLLTLNRPQQRNALNLELLAELTSELEHLKDINVVILTGSDTAFSAGADLKERQPMSPLERTDHTQRISKACDLLADCPVPVIAAISGYCLAGGAELALACDMRLASHNAVFGFPEVSLGIFPGAGGPVRLSQLVGPGMANSLLYSGRRIDAAEALRIGLVEQLSHSALESAIQWANAIAQAPGNAVRTLKAAQVATRNLPPTEAIVTMGRIRQSLDCSDDYSQRLAAFRRCE
jgi:enoyl-CoA hydratase